VSMQRREDSRMGGRETCLAELEALDLLHHFFKVFELLQQLVDLPH